MEKNFCEALADVCEILRDSRHLHGRNGDRTSAQKRGDNQNDGYFFAESACAGCTVPQGAHFSLMARRIYDLAQHVPIRFGECFKAIADVGDVGFFTKQKESVVVNGVSSLDSSDSIFSFVFLRKKESA